MKRPVITNNIQGIFRNNPEMQRFLMDLAGITTDVSEKIDKVVGGEEGNLPILDPGGGLEDGGQSLADIESRAFFFARIY